MNNNTEAISKEQYNEEIKKVSERYKPNNALRIPFKTRLEFFKWWCIVLRPFIFLTDREADVVASLLNKRWELLNNNNIQDPAILDTLMMGNDVLNKVVQECNITKQHFYVVMSSLKKKGVIKDHIDARLIPNLKDDSRFMLTIIFEKEGNET